MRRYAAVAFLGLNLVDLLVLLAVALSIFSGFRRGAVLQLTTYAGLLVGLTVGALLAPLVAGTVGDPAGQAALALATFLAVAGLGDGVGWYLGRRLWAAARRSRFSPVDSAAGSVVAVVAVLLATWFIGLNLVNGPFPSVAREIRDSAVVRGLDATLPHPPSILTEIRKFLNRFGFPQVFQDLPPAPAGPVKGPTQGETAVAARAATASTVRIVGRACDQIQEGSGFVVSDGYVVTNAHVVAGVGAPEVQQQGGGSESAATVLFDPSLDVALLHVTPSPGPAVSLLDGDVGRGATGAVLGYPGGGGLTVGPAAVLRELEAVGKDIYGRKTVRRTVYELQTKVRPGNSGGPFVIIDGRVAGLVFAASTTNSNVGYALTSKEVGDSVRPAIGRTRPVSTGPCTR